MNRYQRRKYGSSSSPGRRAASPLRWQLYLLGLVILMAIVYVRVIR